MGGKGHRQGWVSRLRAGWLEYLQWSLGPRLSLRCGPGVSGPDKEGILDVSSGLAGVFKSTF